MFTSTDILDKNKPELSALDKVFPGGNADNSKLVFFFTGRLSHVQPSD
jgi:hypothetical protein